MEQFDFAKTHPLRNWKTLLFSVLIGLLIMLIFSGKSYNVQLGAVAVSSDEQYVACFETGNGYKIHCFHAGGSLAFTYDIPLGFSSGGHCTLWFKDNTLCVLFYRTNKLVQFDMSGEILNVTDNVDIEHPPEFHLFLKNGHTYCFDGNEMDVIYDRESILRYWLFDAERYLAIILPTGETKVIWAGTATDGVTKKIS